MSKRANLASGWALASVVVNDRARAASDVDNRSVSLKLHQKKATTVNFVNRVLCATFSSNTGPPQRLGGFCQDGNAGLRDVEVLVANNASVAVEGFATGDKGEVGFTATKLSENVLSRVELSATTIDGATGTLVFEF